MALSTRQAVRRKSRSTEVTVLGLIQARPSISRVELAHESGLSTGAITTIVAALVRRGLVVEGAARATTIGRKRIGLTLQPDIGYVVGVDLGTFNLRIVVTDLNGHALVARQTVTKMQCSRTEVLARCFALIREAMEEAGVDPTLVRGIGVAFSGVIDVKNGVILSYPRQGLAEGWKNTPLQRLVEEEFGLPCLLEDSVRAIAISEHSVGLGRDFKDYVYVDVGMGVGSAIFFHGKLYRGWNGSAGEFGHMTVDEDGPMCCCGSYGCLEALASGTRIIENVCLALEKGVSSKVLELAEGDRTKITLEAIAQAAAAGDSLSYRALGEAAAHIGAATSDLVNLLNPQAIIFGGALFRAAPNLLLEHLRRLVRHRAIEKAANDVVLLQAVAGSDAGALGMARLMAAAALQDVYENTSAGASA